MTAEIVARAALEEFAPNTVVSAWQHTSTSRAIETLVAAWIDRIAIADQRQTVSLRHWEECLPLHIAGVEIHGREGELRNIQQEHGWLRRKRQQLANKLFQDGAFALRVISHRTRIIRRVVPKDEVRVER
eukprot:6350336-Prymnesium_polylepis.3